MSELFSTAQINQLYDVNEHNFADETVWSDERLASKIRETYDSLDRGRDGKKSMVTLALQLSFEQILRDASKEGATPTKEYVESRLHPVADMPELNFVSAMDMREPVPVGRHSV